MHTDKRTACTNVVLRECYFLANVLCCRKPAGTKKLMRPNKIYTSLMHIVVCIAWLLAEREKARGFLAIPRANKAGNCLRIKHSVVKIAARYSARRAGPVRKSGCI